ncbi:type IV toxin-antitoxin system AbiEi family antitoxin domain-containing protein [Pseudonocardia humida]|uniref:AbiEi antitoxin of type IV toxin-antitoxin system n=1 Tax=Pseudonocardia humida TaxID=2800819 RepID=A0ABT0ZZM1_9PSEU|nr:hypothetical protein [Pseudonocardia humida]MCO1656200.1 hypothetical protein [Pseudonocardia humida]
MTGDVEWRGRLLASGYTDGELRRMRRDGVLVPLRRGAYAVGTPPAGADAHHLLAIRAACGVLSPDAVVSHASAAVVHGLPVWGVPLERVHVTRGRSRGGRSGVRVHVHAAPLAPEDVVVIGGLRVTTVARTLLDLARTQPFEQAVVLADAALARHAVDPAGLAMVLLRAARWPGLPAARRALAFADGRAESVGESRSRIAIARCGLPRPVPQLAVHDEHGALIGRADFGWPGLATIGEFDGRAKYGRLLRPGQAPADAVRREAPRRPASRSGPRRRPLVVAGPGRFHPGRPPTPGSLPSHLSSTTHTPGHRAHLVATTHMAGGVRDDHQVCVVAGSWEGLKRG